MDVVSITSLKQSLWSKTTGTATLEMGQVTSLHTAVFLIGQARDLNSLKTDKLPSCQVKKLNQITYILTGRCRLESTYLSYFSQQAADAAVGPSHLFQTTHRWTSPPPCCSQSRQLYANKQCMHVSIFPPPTPDRQENWYFPLKLKNWWNKS